MPQSQMHKAGVEKTPIMERGENQDVLHPDEVLLKADGRDNYFSLGK